MRNYKFLSFLVCLMLSFCLSAFAQTVEKEQTPEEKQTEAEVRKFADSFLESFIKTQDLEQIPQEFFDKDFKKRFIEDSDLKDVYFDDGNSQELEAKRIYLLHNFFNLLPLTMSFKCSDFSGLKDSDSAKPFKQCFPPNLLEKLEHSKWLNLMYEDSSEEPKNSEEISQFFEEVDDFSKQFRDYLKMNKVNSSNLANYQKELPNFYGYEKCNGDKCMGLPEETEIFAIHQLMMCLRIAKIDGQWKIVQIFSVASES